MDQGKLMSSKHFILPILSCLCIVFASSAQADDPTWRVDTDKIKITKVSGYKGAGGYFKEDLQYSKSEIDDSTSPRYIDSITLKSFGPIACKILAGRKASRECDAMDAESATALVVSSDTIQSAGPIVTLQVCTAKADDTDRNSIEGVRVWGSSVGNNGVVKKGQKEQFKRSGCKKWHKKVSCPTDMIAIGVRVHRNPKTIRGLNLICAGVKSTGKASGVKVKAESIIKPISK